MYKLRTCFSKYFERFKQFIVPCMKCSWIIYFNRICYVCRVVFFFFLSDLSSPLARYLGAFSYWRTRAGMLFL